MSRSTSTKRAHGEKPHNEKEMCWPSRKVRHRSKKAAATVLNQMRGKRVGSNRQLGTVPTYVYKCEHCSGWHLTSSTR